MSTQDLLTSMKQLVLQFYDDTVSREAVQVPLLTFNRIDPTVIPLRTLTITFSDLWDTPDIDRIKLLDKFLEILPTFSSFRENLEYNDDLVDFLATLLDKLVEDMNSYTAEQDKMNEKLQDLLLSIFYLTLDNGTLTAKWHVHMLKLEVQLVYLIAAHSQLNLPNSEKTLKGIVKLITKTYPKIDFNILLEMGQEYRLKWKFEKRGDLLRCLLFHPELHTDSILEGILLQIILPLKDKITTLKAPRYAYHWIMNHVRFPYIGLHIDKLAPPSLQLLSCPDTDENVLIGLKALANILEYIGLAQLRAQNLHKVYRQHLSKILLHGSAACLERAVPVSLTLINMLEYPPPKTPELWRTSEYDLFMIEFLEQAAYVTTVDKQVIFARGLTQLIRTFDHVIIKHLKGVLTLVIEYMKCEQRELRLVCLQCLKLLLHHGWPRVTAHSIDILMACVNVSEGEHSNPEIHGKVVGVVGTLQEQSGGSLDYYLEKLKGSPSKGAQALATSVFESKKEKEAR